MYNIRMNYLEEILSYVHNPKYSNQKLMQLIDLARNRPWELNPVTTEGSAPAWLSCAWAALMYQALKIAADSSAKGEKIPIGIVQVTETQLELVPLNLKGKSEIHAMLRHINVHTAYAFLWESSGKHIYDVTLELSWIFANTIIEDIPTEYVVLPYKCSVINLHGLKPIVDDTQGVVELTHAILTQDLEDEELITITFNGKAETSPNVYRLTTYRMELNLGEKLIKDAVDTKGKEFFVPYIHYCINVLMYITSKESDDILKASSLDYIKLAERAKKAKGPAKKRFKEQLIKIPPRYIHHLGTKIIIDRKRTEVGTVLNSSSGAISAPRIGHFVRGHWHHYRVGEGRKELLRKLLRPYWRGAPPTEEQLMETHVVLLK